MVNTLIESIQQRLNPLQIASSEIIFQIKINIFQYILTFILIINQDAVTKLSSV